MILIIGSNGNMGKRYKAALEYLGHTVRGVDINDAVDVRLLGSANSVIVATPTDTHYNILVTLYKNGYRKPVLCEKPISKVLGEVKHIEKISEEMPVTMVFQYNFVDYFVMKTARFVNKVKYQSYYNYFKTGSDGLKWDCTQIICMSQNKPLLLNDSPVWDCVINGYAIETDSMDRAYLRMLTHWIENPGWNYSDLYAMHQKVVDFG